MRGRTDSSYEHFEIQVSGDDPAINATGNVPIKLCPWNTLGGATSGPTGPLAVLRLVRFVASERAVSRKNTPKTTLFYTSKIIIPARTLPPGRD